MGPVVNEKQRQRVLQLFDQGVKEGARMIVEGGAAEVPGKAGHYVKPALMEGTLENVAAREEIFGPVAYLAKFDSEDEALAMVNSTDYGLANSVWSSDLGRCCTDRRTDAGRQLVDQRPQRLPARRALRRHRQIGPRRRRQLASKRCSTTGAA